MFVEQKSPPSSAGIFIECFQKARLLRSSTLNFQLVRGSSLRACKPRG
jgi:hypothetical protein